jgi:hypothetical protein
MVKLELNEKVLLLSLLLNDEMKYGVLYGSVYVTHHNILKLESFGNNHIVGKHTKNKVVFFDEMCCKRLK